MKKQQKIYQSSVAFSSVESGKVKRMRITLILIIFGGFVYSDE
jgi:hypothetical protein